MTTLIRSIVSVGPLLATLLLAGLLATGCAAPLSGATGADAGITPTAQPAPTQAPTIPPTTAPASAISEEALKNGQYRLPDVGDLRLQDGEFEYKYGEGATQTYRVGYSQSAAGDLNGDGRTDAVVALWLNSGGSGTWTYIVVVLDQEGQAQQVAAEMLGDRVKVQNLAVRDGQIVVNVLAFAPGDPMCCPSQRVTRSYKLVDGTLKVVSEVKATPRAAQAAPTPAAGPATQPAPGADAQLAGVRFDPSAHACSGEPARTMTDQTWQANAVEEGGYGTKPAMPGQKVTVQLRNKLGDAAAQYQVRVSVVAPDGSVASADAPLKGNDLLRLDYPQAFAGAQPTTSGTYTVLWQVNGGFVTCWGWEVN